MSKPFSTPGVYIEPIGPIARTPQQEEQLATIERTVKAKEDELAASMPPPTVIRVAPGGQPPEGTDSVFVKRSASGRFDFTIAVNIPVLSGGPPYRYSIGGGPYPTELDAETAGIACAVSNDATTIYVSIAD